MDTSKYILRVGEIRSSLPNTPSWLRITTITMIGREICGAIKAQEVRNLFKRIGSIKINNGFEWTVQKAKKGSQFYNCVYIGYTDAYSRKHVKLFKNGSVQIAGCSSILDCQFVVAQLKVLLPVILNRDIDMEWSDFDVVMINATFNVSQKLHLFHVARDLHEKDEFDVQYDPESYHALSMRFKATTDKKVYAKLFTTGSVQISGAKTLMDCAEAYRIVNEATLNHRVGEANQKDQKDIIFGYPFEDWIKKLSV